MAALLEADGLSKAFGGLVAVSNMSLAVSPGEVLGLIGPNGSGKTTLLNLIAGTIRCDAGSIRIGGEDVTRLPNHLRVRKRINRTFQLVRMPPNLPAIVGVMAGVMYGAEPKRYKDAEYEAAGILGELNLLLKAGHRLDQLTYIEQKRVELARARHQAARPAARRMALGTEPRRARRRHVGGLESRRARHRRDPGRACDDRGAGAVLAGGGDERRRQDCRRAAGSGAARCGSDPRLSRRRRRAGFVMLDIHGLSHAYGRHKALDDVSIRLRAGEAVAILGANGAGKTTLLNAIAGLVRPASGSIRFEGRELVGLSPHRIVEMGIATVPENRRLFEPMSVMENLNLGAYLGRARGAAGATLERIFELFPRLAERRRQAVRTMSGGERQMVAIGRALMTQPRLLLLDEPSLGLSPRLSGELFAVLARIAHEVSVLMVEQNARRALATANRAYLLALGRIVGEGEATALARDSAVARSYLGL